MEIYDTAKTVNFVAANLLRIQDRVSKHAKLIRSIKQRGYMSEERNGRFATKDRYSGKSISIETLVSITFRGFHARVAFSVANLAFHPLNAT